jgi:hypothetical protein
MYTKITARDPKLSLPLPAGEKEVLEYAKGEKVTLSFETLLAMAGIDGGLQRRIGGLRERNRSNGAGEEPPEKGRTAWKIQYKLGPKVDPTGALADGRAFENISALNHLLAGDPERLASAFVAHLSRYATGTDVGYADRAEIRRIVESTKACGYRLRALVHALGSSRLIQPEMGEHP